MVLSCPAAVSLACSLPLGTHRGSRATFACTSARERCQQRQGQGGVSEREEPILNPARRLQICFSLAHTAVFRTLLSYMHSLLCAALIPAGMQSQRLRHSGHGVGKSLPRRQQKRLHL